MDRTPPALKVSKYALVNGYLLFAVGIFYLCMDLGNLADMDSLGTMPLPSFPYWMTNEDGNIGISLKGASFRDTAVIRSIADCLWLVALLLMFRKLRTNGRDGSLSLFKILFCLEVVIFAFFKLFPLLKEFNRYRSRYTICYITAAFVVIVFYVCHTLNTLKASFALQEQLGSGWMTIVTVVTEKATPNQLEEPKREEPKREEPKREERKPVLPDPMPTIVVDEKGKVYSADTRY